MKQIGILTTWNSVCGCSELAHHWVCAMERLGYQVTIFGNHFAGTCQPIDSRKDDPQNVFRIFHTGHQTDEKLRKEFDLAKLKDICTKREITAFFVIGSLWNYPDKEGIKGIIDFIKNTQRGSVYYLANDVCFLDGQWENYHWDSILYPKILQVHPGIKALRNGIMIDHGMPEYTPPQVREYFYDPEAFNWIGSFGLGRNRIQDLVPVVKELNQEKQIGRSYRIAISLPSQHAYEENKQFFLENQDILQPRVGYLEELSLLNFLHSMGAVTVWYHNNSSLSCSSGIRMALSAEVPVLGNCSSWTADFHRSGAWIEFNGEPTGIKAELKKLFESGNSHYQFKREQLVLHQRYLKSTSGWNAIAKQYLALVEGDITKT